MRLCVCWFNVSSQLDVEGLDTHDEEAILGDSVDALFVKVQILLASKLDFLCYFILFVCDGRGSAGGEEWV